MSRRNQILLVLGLVALGLGLPGLLDRFVNGHINTAYGSGTPWALWVVFYVYFIGLSAGAFLISSMIYVFGFKQYEKVGKLALFTALVCLIVALLFISLDLGHIFRAWEVFLRPHFRSPMTWMVWLYALYFLILLGEIWFLMRRDLISMRSGTGIKEVIGRILSLGSRDVSETSYERDIKVVRVLGSIGVPVAIAFHGGVGALFAVLAAHPYWYTGLYPIMFLISALASGGALLTAITAFLLDGKGKYADVVVNLGRLVLIFLIIDIIIEFAEISVSLYGGSPAHVQPFLTQMFGPYWWTFWVLGIGMALVIPALILAFRSKSHLWVGSAALIAVVGFVGVRWNIVLPGFATELLPGLRLAYQDPRLAFVYSPTIMEWSVTIGLIGLAILLFILGYQLLPLLTRVEETKEVA